MDYKSHLLIGVLSGLAAGHFLFSGLSYWQLALFCAISGFCALLPDIDLRSSKISQIACAAALLFSFAAALFLHGIGVVQQMLVFALLVLLFAIADLLFRPRHRGITHSLAFCAVLVALAYALSGGFFAAALAIGFLSHLLADFKLKLA